MGPLIYPTQVTPETSQCWADATSTLAAYCVNPCNQPAIGTLGLCPRHASEILPLPGDG